ncbi:MAG: NGG1p interacting factor NIF3 [Legionellaceae bacterium]|nr:NGG1p interacting factor NIF3 [Legionellaceae bacterium]HCA89849.1 NGG1p interacting factor NIF3 [Legionellales bacterium]
MYKLIFYVPVDFVDIVKKAVFSAGAGTLGNYQQCAWQTKGTGQFYATSNAHPTIGKPEEVTVVEEYRVEILCDEACIRPAIGALKRVHPYESPAYEVIRLEVI